MYSRKYKAQNHTGLFGVMLILGLLLGSGRVDAAAGCGVGIIKDLQVVTAQASNETKLYIVWDLDNMIKASAGTLQSSYFPKSKPSGYKNNAVIIKRSNEYANSFDVLRSVLHAAFLAGQPVSIYTNANSSPCNQFSDYWMVAVCSSTGDTACGSSAY